MKVADSASQIRGADRGWNSRAESCHRASFQQKGSQAIIAFSNLGKLDTQRFPYGARSIIKRVQRHRRIRWVKQAI